LTLRDVALRPAHEDDVHAFWEWRNEVTTRAASLNQEPLPFEQHEQWFRARLDDPDTLLYVVHDASRAPIGYVRFTLDGTEAEISIALDPASRGRGSGAAAIRLACALAFATGRVSRVVAQVKLDNESSVHAFVSAGFGATGVADFGGTTTVLLEHTRPPAARRPGRAAA
jgi:RimJ/RimL family protein N-acetyltransferase